MIIGPRPARSAVNPNGEPPGGRSRRRQVFLVVTLLLLTSGAVLAQAPPPAQTDTASSPPAQAGRQSQAEPQRFDIPAGELQAALLAFSRQVDLQLLYPAELTSGRQTQGVQGSYTPEQAYASCSPTRG